jgi:uncharacterized delta-60 repeat protein
MKKLFAIIILFTLTMLLAPSRMASPVQAGEELSPAAPTGLILPGSIDQGFDPGDINGAVRDMLLQPDGKIIIRGSFSQVQGTARDGLARLYPDGSHDTSFDPGDISGGVSDFALQPDGKLIIGGSFTSVQGTDINRIARLKDDGTLDTSFDPGDGPDDDVDSLALQSDGKIILAGDFTKVDNTNHGHMARLESAGELDATFSPLIEGTTVWIADITLQPDGKILIAGDFETVNNNPLVDVARLRTDGVPDLSFDPGSGPDWFATSVAVQKDGKVLVGGRFTQFNGEAHTGIVRLDSSGEVDDSFDPNAGEIRDIDLQPDGKIIIGGLFNSVDGVDRDHVARLDTNGELDSTFLPPEIPDGEFPGNGVYAVLAYPYGQVLVAGDFDEIQTPARGLEGTITRNYLAQYNPDGSLDTGFDTSNGPNSYLNAVVLQTDSKVLIGGLFTSIGGIPIQGVARLNANSTLDNSFNSNVSANVQQPLINAIVIQPDGKVIIGGIFNKVDDISRNGIARLNDDGTLDTTFDPGTGLSGGLPSSLVAAIILQSDGKLIIAGKFTHFNDIPRNHIARLNEDGSLDDTFDPGKGPDDEVHSLALQTDGKIVIGGLFTSYNDITRNHLARLDSGGSLDTSFDPGDGPDGAVPVRAIVIQPDDKFIVGGDFTNIDGIRRWRVARLNTDGSVDLNYDTSMGPNDRVHTIVLQSDGKALIGGLFTEVNSTTCNGIARLNTDGSLDTNFSPGSGAEAGVHHIATQLDGKIIIGGFFTQVDGEAHRYIARLNGGEWPAITSDDPKFHWGYGETFEHTFTASGFPVPGFYISGGKLPPGLTLDGETGELSGTFTQLGTYQFKVTACNYVVPSDSETISMMVVKADTTTAITSHTPDPSAPGQGVTVSYSVTSTGGTPTGNVTVSDGTKQCTGTVAAGSCSLTFDSVGTKTLTATYAGDDNFEGSTSDSVQHSVEETIEYKLFLPVLVNVYNPNLSALNDQAGDWLAGATQLDYTDIRAASVERKPGEMVFTMQMAGNLPQTLPADQRNRWVWLLDTDMDANTGDPFNDIGVEYQVNLHIQWDGYYVDVRNRYNQWTEVPGAATLNGDTATLEVPVGYIGGATSFDWFVLVEPFDRTPGFDRFDQAPDTGHATMR